MRFVIYDDETLEPVTFVHLPGVSREDIERRGRRWRVAVPGPMKLSSVPVDAELMTDAPPVLDLEFERFCRNTRKHGLQESIICFTSAIDLALMLNPDFMLGQRGVVDYLQSQNDRLTDMLFRAWSARP